MLTDEQRQLGAQQWQQEEARRPREENLRLWIEAWQRGDRQCPRCGGSNVVKNGGGNGTPQCLCKDCRADNGGKGGYFTAPKETVPLEENEPPMQMMPEIQPMQMNQGEGPTFALNFTLPTMLQTSMQGMNQFNPQQQVLIQNDMEDIQEDISVDNEFQEFLLQLEMDENNNNNNLNNNYNYDADDGFDEDDDFDVPLNRKPKEVKERREDYENQESYSPGPGEMGYQRPQLPQTFQQPMQMLSSNVFGFNLAGQDVNQFYTVQPIQQTFDPNLFNANNEQSFNIQRIPVLQMDINRNDTQQQDEQIDLVMQQNTQGDQNQQPMNDQPDLNLEPTQVLQQIPAQYFQFDPVGDYVNALNADTQELTQYNNLLWGLIQSGQSGNADQLGLVVAAAQAVVNRAHQRELRDNANQIILSVLGADPRYEKAADAFAEQLKIFNNVLETIQKAGQ